MPTIEERVGQLEVSMAELKGQIGADLRHIDDRFDMLNASITEVRNAIAAMNTSITSLNVGAATVSQKSTTNEKIIFAAIGTVISTATFVAGKFL